MWSKFLLAVVASLLPGLVLAVSPYYHGDRIKADSLAGVASAVETRLRAHGFVPVGRYFPRGLPEQGVVIATRPGLQQAAAAVGRHAILASVVRVGIERDGDVSWTNPEYWGRAYLRDAYGAQQRRFDQARDDLKDALGQGQPFGGDETARKLADYRYMFGMEKLDSARNKLARADNFVDAVRIVREHLAAATGNTSQVYEVVLPDARLAVFGVAFDDPEHGDANWLSAIKRQQIIAGLPYEIYVVGDEILAPFARFRVALAFPDVGMGQFMRISRLPAYLFDTLRAVAGADDEAKAR